MPLTITFPDSYALDFDAILTRMLNALPDGYDKAEGSQHYNLLSPAAVEIALLGLTAQQVLERGFAQTTFGEYLRLRAEEHGVIKKLATYSKGIVTFTGVEGAVVDAGRVVSTASTETTPAILFTVDTTVTIGGGESTVSAAVTASQAGAGSNVAAGTILYMAQSISGIAGVTNAAPTAGGTDDESDPALLDRYLTEVRSPGTSGNKSDYRDWALEVTGVGGVRVLPLWDGPGTVKVVIVDTDKLPASSGLVDDVQAYIAPDDEGSGKAPIGADVTVVSADGVDIDISAVITLTGSHTLSQVKTAFEVSLVDYLKSLVFADDPTVRYVRIGSLLLDTPGVQDYASLTVNTGTGNITIDEDEVAVKGTVSFT